MLDVDYLVAFAHFFFVLLTYFFSDANNHRYFGAYEFIVEKTAHNFSFIFPLFRLAEEQSVSYKLMKALKVHCLIKLHIASLLLFFYIFMDKFFVDQMDVKLISYGHHRYITLWKLVLSSIEAISVVVKI